MTSRTGTMRHALWPFNVLYRGSVDIGPCSWPGGADPGGAAPGSRTVSGQRYFYESDGTAYVPLELARAPPVRASISREIGTVTSFRYCVAMLLLRGGRSESRPNPT